MTAGYPTAKFYFCEKILTQSLRNLLYVIFSFCHLYPMCGFLLFCHNKRTSYELDFIIEEPFSYIFTEKVSHHLVNRFNLKLPLFDSHTPSDLPQLQIIRLILIYFSLSQRKNNRKFKYCRNHICPSLFCNYPITESYHS